MKIFKFILFAFVIALFTACGSLTQPKETHEHSDSCTDSHNTNSPSETSHQESFTVEADSIHSHSDSCSHKKEKTHSHTHSDGKIHTH